MRHITRAATCGGAAELPAGRAAHSIARSLAIRSRSAGGARSCRSLLRSVRAPEAWFTDAKLVGADLTGAGLDGKDFTQLTFKLACRSEGKGPTFGNAGLSRTYLAHTPLRGADLSGADCTEVRLKVATSAACV